MKLDDKKREIKKSYFEILYLLLTASAIGFGLWIVLQALGLWSVID